MVPLDHAQRMQTQGRMSDIFEVGHPGNVVPDSQVLVPHRNPFGLFAGDPHQGLGQRIDRHPVSPVKNLNLCARRRSDPGSEHWRFFAVPCHRS